MHGLVNAGYQRGGLVWRTETIGDSFEPRPFNVYCAKSIAGIALERHLPEATMSRGLVLNLRRKLPHESVERLRHADHGVFVVLAAKLARFAADSAPKIANSRPELPAALNDRQQDNWEPLLTIAKCAGPEWFERATAAALRLSNDGDSAETLGSQLMGDIDAAFDAKRETKLCSVDLIEALVSDPDAPWATWNRGKPLTPRQLAKLLAPYGIKSRTVRVKQHTPKGYELAQFEDATARYRGTTPGLPPRRNISPEALPGRGCSVADADAATRNTLANPQLGNGTTAAGHEPVDVAHQPPHRNAAATPKPLQRMGSGGVAAETGEAADDDSEPARPSPTPRAAS